MKAFQKVRLIKREINNPITNYQDGYWTEGFLGDDVEIGKKILLIRNKHADPENYNNAVLIDGVFQSTEVKRINGNLITTQNSVWEVTELKDEEKN